MLEFISKSIVVNRKKRGLTQEELAEKLDVSSAAISKWERGISTPELSMVCKRFMDNLSGRMISFLDVQLERNEFSIEKMKDAQKAMLQIYSMIKE